MIATLSGRLKRKAADYLVVEVCGVGYQVQAPLSTYCNLPEAGEEVTLQIHTHVREDALSLFGFLTETEKEMFLLLMGVSGIGPRLALAILSSLSVADISSALQSSDDSKLCTIPGIGKKTAARMVLELKDKIKLQRPDNVSDERVPAGTERNADAVSALVNLGYKKPLAEEAVRKITADSPGNRLETVIREALRELMKR